MACGCGGGGRLVSDDQHVAEGPGEGGCVSRVERLDEVQWDPCTTCTHVT